MMTGLTLTQFISRSNLVAYAFVCFVWEKVEIVFLFIFFLFETIVACELKFCIYNQLNE